MVDFLISYKNNIAKVGKIANDFKLRSFDLPAGLATENNAFLETENGVFLVWDDPSENNALVYTFLASDISPLTKTKALYQDQLYSQGDKMAHFAELDSNNKVIRVVVINNNELIDNGVESEIKGINFLNSLFGSSNWKQTSYNGNIRKNYAGVGYYYDANRDAFIAPQPFLSWILNTESCRWEAPIPCPNDGRAYIWNEHTLSWDAKGN